MKAEIERLTVNMNAFGLGMKREKERADTARAEAIKEFWDRLQKDFPNLFAGQHPCVLSEIDFLVKEPAEEQNGNL